MNTNDSHSNSRVTWRLEVAIGSVGSVSGGSDRVSLTKKILGHGLGLGRVEFRVEHYRFFLGLGSSFEFLLTQVISNFGSFGFGSGRVSGHLISDNLRFRVISGWVKSNFELSRVGSGRISGRRTLKYFFQ
jgi:hypothetical protein